MLIVSYIKWTQNFEGILVHSYVFEIVLLLFVIEGYFCHKRIKRGF